jgi:ATP-dependent exoDNAse (exonuclease V) alpha subunit
VCETAHRAKGLEYDHVILVVHHDTVSDEILYVGISRAVISLTIIGPKTLGERLGTSVRPNSRS